MFIPLAKIDEEKRLVIGRAVQEVVDRTNEIIDYATAKPAFEKWSKDFESMSGGLSKGNVRVMHNPRVVAGKVTDLSFNDADKAIDVVVKVVDDNEWKKVVEGVYTGFSVGGGYGRKWKDEQTGATRYTPVVSELSLVDNPCIPTCRIAELHKADGMVQELHLHGRAREFAEIFKATRSFTELMLEKGWSSNDHPREHDGKFARKTGEMVGRGAGALALGAAGALAGRRFGPQVGAAAGRLASKVMTKNPITRMTVERTGENLGHMYGTTAGGIAGALGGFFGGGAVGAVGDRRGRNKRAKAAYQDNVATGKWKQEEADAATALYQRSKGKGLERQRRIEGLGKSAFGVMGAALNPFDTVDAWSKRKGMATRAAKKMRRPRAPGMSPPSSGL